VDEVVRTAGEAMITAPVRHALSATVGEIRYFFGDDHVHAALIVSPAGYLRAIVERDDIAGCRDPEAAVAPLGRLAGRTVAPGASLAEVYQAMSAAGRRRVAVTGADGRLLGLLCLKASRTGFCSDQDVRARAEDAGAAGADSAGISRPRRLTRLPSGSALLYRYCHLLSANDSYPVSARPYVCIKSSGQREANRRILRINAGDGGRGEI
jgi:hypothetical protein